MKGNTFRIAKQTHQQTHKLLKSISSKLISDYPHVAVLNKENLKPQIRKRINEAPSIASKCREKSQPRRKKSNLSFYALFNNNNSMQQDKETKDAIKFTPISIDQVQEAKGNNSITTNGAYRTALMKSKAKDKELAHKDNDQLYLLRNFISSYSKQSTHSTSSLYSDFKSYQKGTCIKSSIGEKEDLNPKHFSKSIYCKFPTCRSDISGHKNKENNQIQSTQCNQPNNLDYYQKKETSVLSRNRLPSTGSIDLSIRNKTNQYSSMNDTCGVSVSNCNVFNKRNNEHANNKFDVNTAEEVHFKFVEMFQQKKLFYIKLSQQQNHYEAEEIENCYLEKEKI